MKYIFLSVIETATSIILTKHKKTNTKEITCGARHRGLEVVSSAL